MCAETTGANDVLSDGIAIDAEVHVDAPAGDVAAYCDQPFRRRLQSDSAFPKDLGSDWRVKDDTLADGQLTSVADVRSRVCERFGVDHPVLSLATGIQKLPNGDVASHLMRAYNDYLLDQYLDGSTFHGLAEMSPQQPENAAEEIDRMGDEKQIAGVMIGTTGAPKPLGDPQYDVIYRAAEENDLPVVYHSASGPHFRHDFPKQNQGLRSSFPVDTLSHLWSQTLTFSSLVVQGVPEKFPGLDFVFQEVGLSWVPYMTWRLNKEYSIQKPQAPLLSQSPEEYVNDSCYFAYGSLGSPLESSDLATVVDIVGSDSIVFSTNAPYTGVDDGDALSAELSTLFGPDEREEVLYETPRSVFDLPV